MQDKLMDCGTPVPRHVAVIMDGNGRWARQRGLPRLDGHREGVKSVEAIVRACRHAGVRYLTLYAFSTENWNRPKSEVAGLMRLLRDFLKRHECELHEHRIRLRVLGRLQDLPLAVRHELQRVVRETEPHDAGDLILALSYGSRDEIAHAARSLARQVAAGRLAADAVDEAALAARLYLPEVPDPDLLIRTSGEMRLSNFMLWQLSYAEFYFTETLWPDFREDDFRKALQEYGRRQRRFGGVGNTKPGGHA
ncbi:MAG: isoprenyl transferase [Kiritimatiellia bacterium]